MSSTPRERRLQGGEAQGPLSRLIAPLKQGTLTRIARAYGIKLPHTLRKQPVRECLLAAPQLDAQEIVAHMLSVYELRRACQGLGLSSVGSEPALISRLRRALRWRPFAEARAFARGLGLQNRREWRAWCQGPGRPADIPAVPRAVYQHAGWSGMGDWLGTGNRANWQLEFLPFEEARAYARGLGLGSAKAWRSHCKTARRRGTLPAGIPAGPENTYARCGWQGYGDWLGTGARSRLGREFRDFESARAFARELGLGSQREWYDYSAGRLPDLGRLPLDVPANPAAIYADDGWQGYRDWLGTAGQSRFLPFAAAREVARSLGFRTGADWQAWSDRPDDLPANPRGAYLNAGWRGWGDWLGTGALSASERSSRLLPFAEARAFARSLGLPSSHAWRAWLRGERPELPRRPETIPVAPSLAYATGGWVDWPDWLGPTAAVLSDDEREDLGRRVRAWRVQQGLTQPQVAELLGCGVTALRNWEGGKSRVSRRYAAAIRELVDPPS